MTPVAVFCRKMEIPPLSSCGSLSRRTVVEGPSLASGKAVGRAAFSLVEVALALGIISFALLGVLGLLPVSLDMHRNAMQRQVAMEALQQASVAVGTQSRHATNGSYVFNDWLSQAGLPLSWKPGDAVKDYTLDLLADGTIRRGNTPASTPTYQKLHLRVAAPAVVTNTSLPNGPVMVKVSVAWPAAAQWDGQTWKNSAGSLDTVLYALPY